MEYKAFTDKENEYIINNYKDKTFKEIGIELNRTKKQIEDRVKLLRKAGKITEYKTEIKKANICFDCQRAAGKNMCQWAKCLKPIPGWDAELTVVDKWKSSEFFTWCIKNCPLFIPDIKRNESNKIGKELPKKENRRRVGVTIEKDGLTVIFPTIEKAIEYIMAKTEKTRDQIYWRMTKRKKGIYGYNVQYEKSGAEC